MTKTQLTPKRFISLLCALVLTAALLSGCGESGDGIIDAPVDLTPTDELNILVPLYSDYLFNLAISIFKKNYPDVSLTVENISDSPYLSFSVNHT